MSNVDLTIKSRWVILCVLILGYLFPVTVTGQTLTIGGTGGGLGPLRQLGAAFEKLHPGVSVNVLSSLGSSGGIKAVADGVIDLAVTSRPMKEKEKKPGLKSFGYAKTAIAVVGNRDHGTTNVTRSDLINMIDGTTKNWPDKIALQIVLRPQSDTDTKIVTESLPDVGKSMKRARKRRGILIGITDQDAADLLEKLPGSIGLIALSLVLSENRRLKVFSLDGIVPSRDTIENDRYPITKTFYLVTGPKSGSITSTFVDFIRSATGKSILEQSGHVTVGTKGK